MEYTVRPYCEEDCDFVWDLHIRENQAYIDRHIKASDESIREWFDQNMKIQTGFIVEQADKPVGCYFIHESPDYIKLSRFFLIDEIQGKGLGTGLLAEVLREFVKPEKPFHITVWVDNPVQAFWRKNGFIAVSTDADNLTLMKYQPAL